MQHKLEKRIDKLEDRLSDGVEEIDEKLQKIRKLRCP
jgi:prefoldin subunit 5